METTLPFATLQGRKHLPLSVQVAEPFSLLFIFKMFPGILM